MLHLFIFLVCISGTSDFFYSCAFGQPPSAFPLNDLLDYGQKYFLHIRLLPILVLRNYCLKDSHLAPVCAMCKSLEIFSIFFVLYINESLFWERISIREIFSPMLWLTVDRETKTQTKPQCAKDSAEEPKLHLPAKHQPDWEISRLAPAALVMAYSMFLCSDAWFSR